MSVGVGFALGADDEFLALTVELAARADYLEVTPESLWYERGDGVLAPNDYHARFLGAAHAMGKPIVAHGVAYGMGSGDPSDVAHRARWRARMAEDHARFRFGWWTDHGGTTSLAGQNITLPVATVPSDESARCLAERLIEMQRVVPLAGVENSALYFVLGDPLDDATMLARGIALADAHLLLDLHNLHTNALNLGFDPDAWLARIDLSRVIEIHVSGGSSSDASWSPTGQVMRLDAHDSPVPEEVWSLLDRVLSRCTTLRGVTLERMEGTVHDERDVDLLHAELDRVRFAVRGRS